MALSSSLSPLFLSSVPSSVPYQSSPRGRSSRKELIDEQVLSSSTSAAIPMSRALTPCSLKEAEIETSIYFPTFAARRRSSPQRHEMHHEKRSSPKEAMNAQQDKRSPVSFASRQHYHDTFEEEEEDIFALDDCDEEQEELMDEDDGAQLTADIPSLDLDQMTMSSSSRRRSEQTNSSSISDQDLQMVWEEEDDEEDEEGGDDDAQGDDSVIIRKGSTSSSTASTSLIRRESLVASRKPTIKPTLIQPSLTFARRVQRPSEITIITSNKGSSPTFSHHWQKARRGSSSVPKPLVQQPLRRSSTIIVARPAITSRTASLERYKAFPIGQGSESLAVNMEMQKLNGIRSNTFPYLASLQEEKSKTQLSSPSSILFGGRKRSATDPLAVHPPYQTKADRSSA